MVKSRLLTSGKVICFVLSVYTLYLIVLNNYAGVSTSKGGFRLDGESSKTNSKKLLIPKIEPSELSKFSMDDPILLNYLRAYHISPPSKLSYRFSSARFAPGGSEKIITAVTKIFKDTIFNKQKGGFFVEVGAFDGVTSNSLFLEREYGWSGLLIECHPKLIRELRRVNRHSYVADVCLSTSNKSSVMELISSRDKFNKYPGSSSLDNTFFKRTKQAVNRFNVTTVPLYSILAAIEVNIVDFIVLDVQGIELKVLKVFPFHLISVKVWAIEYPESENSQMEMKEIEQIMRLNGYKEPIRLENDFIFVHKSVKT